MNALMFAATAFADWHSVTVPDPEHSIGEWRYYLLGMSERGNLLVVCHTERGKVIRILFNAQGSNERSLSSTQFTLILVN